MVCKSNCQMTDISVIILTKDEKLHIKRCLERLAPLAPRQIFIVDCFSTDGTQEIVKQHSAEIGSFGAEEFRERAVAKVEEWLDGISEDVFVAVLDKLLDEKTLSGEYRFKGDGGKVAMREGAIRFFREFSRRIVQLSDGRCVYFTPDERARKRNQDNAVSWAEYAVHAVTSSGKMLEGKEYRERLYNPHKANVLQMLESVISAEHCMFRLIDAHPENDAVLFIGHDADGSRLEVVTRLDLFGNVDANLAEVKVVAMHKKAREKGSIPPPKYYRPLTEVVETVAKHQAAGFSPSTTESSIAYLAGKRKGVKPSNSLTPSLPHSPTLQLQLETPTINFVQHEWPGLQSIQFNWALDTLPINAKWILRLDADEYLTPESIEWLKANLDGIDEKVGALEFTLERKFMGGEVRHGTNGIQMVRMFRRGRGRYAETLMDERIVFEGEKLPVPVVFYDDNLNTLEWWKEKHRGYAKREAQQAVAGTFQDPRKAKYYRLPPYLRAFVYFCVRYFLKLGFLDGVAGFRWHFWQGLWYRCLVDREIGRMKSIK